MLENYEVVFPSEYNNFCIESVQGFFFFFFSLKNSVSVQFSSVAQLCLTLCGPMKRSTSGLPVHHQLLESTQTHVH